MAGISEESPKQLIDRLKFNDNITSDVNGFDSRKHLFDFGIDSDLSLNEEKRIPKLSDGFNKSKCGLDIDLRGGMREAIKNNQMIKNYDNNQKHKWTHFLRCLHKNNTIEEEVPTFVTLSSIVANFCLLEEWDSSFFALKYNGVIYLFTNKSLKMDEEVDEEVTPHVYYNTKFHYLITDNNADINGFEKCLSVDRIDFNGNKIIVCNVIAAKDRKGSSVWVKCRHIDQSMDNKRQLNDWSYCMLNGVKTLILGRRYGSTLQEVEVLDVDSIPVKCRSFWSESKCYSFVDQSLEFIKSCVSSELELYEFVVNSSDKTLSCFKHESDDNSNHFLPKFYTN